MSGFSFDEKEFADPEEDAADAAISSLEQSPEATQEDPELADVDLRLETADYYRAILNHTFFDTSSQAAEIVDREVRAFIRERLEVLLGLRSPRTPEVAELPFSEDEVDALHLLASKVMRNNGLLSSSESKTSLVKKMPTPAPAPRHEVARPKPQVKKVAPPAPAPSTKPKPKVRPPEPKKVQAAQPQQAKKATAPAKPLPNAESQTFVSNITGQEVTLIEGETIVENGRKYLVVRNDMGTLYRKDISGQVIPQGMMQQMTPQQMSMMSERHANDTLARIDQTTGMAIVASLIPKE
jgi:hypothetical protein